MTDLENKVDPVEKYILDAKKAFNKVSGTMGFIVGVCTFYLGMRVNADVVDILPIAAVGVFLSAIFGFTSKKLMDNAGDVFFNIKRAEFAAEGQKTIQPPSPT